MTFKTQQFYAPELKCMVSLHSLSVAGAVRLRAVQAGIKNEAARNMALILETLRDGLEEPALHSNKELMEFAQRYPDLTARIFMTINELSIT